MEDPRNVVHSRQRSRSLLRHRRALAVLSLALVGAVALVSWPGLHRLWWVVGGVAAALMGHVGFLLHRRERAAAQEMGLAFHPAPVAEPVLAWPSLLHGDVGADVLGARPAPAARSVPGLGADGATVAARVPEHLLDRWTVTRWLWAGAAAWLLEAVVVLTERILGDTSSAQGASRVWMERSARLQAYLARHSRRALTASAAASVSATAIGTLVAPARAVAAVDQSTPAPSPATWQALRSCESGGDYAADTGNGYFGAYQFSAATWRGLGYAGLADQAAPALQDRAAVQLWQQAGWAPWPACAARLGLTSASTGQARIAGIAPASSQEGSAVPPPGRAGAGGAPSGGIPVGQITQAPVSRAPGAGSRTYAVRPGDTLSAIARRYATTVPALAAANHLSDPDRIDAGQVLQVTSR